MGHKNYSKHFKSNKEQEPDTTFMGFGQTIEPAIELEEKVLEVGGEVIEAEENEEIVVNTVEGIVSGCKKLYVREKADKESVPLCTIEEDSEVIVDLAESTMYFYKVCTSLGVEGYCMKEYISVK